MTISRLFIVYFNIFEQRDSFLPDPCVRRRRNQETAEYDRAPWPDVFKKDFLQSRHSFRILCLLSRLSPVATVVSPSADSSSTSSKKGDGFDEESVPCPEPLF